MNPDTGCFERLTEEQAWELGRREGPLAEREERHGIKQAQIFRVGEVIEVKGAKYRVKSIHTRSLVLTPCYPE